MVGKICKGTSIILFILAFIGSISLADQITINGDFNWTIFFCGLIISFLFCLQIYAMGEIIDQLECSNSNTYELYQLIDKSYRDKFSSKKSDFKNDIVNKSYSNPYPTNSTIGKNANGGWTCKKCNSQNNELAQFCKDCGAYK